ncbi:MAG: DNA alkylation repair enzyme [Candidatus Methanofastidiosum methylothiophilum]|uniref:DNA alkylation repair enzyme n=1 Tax=Candidatus Methanofastidiosum methylothiophilum TaxID=1705564 RepID=A0A150J3J8_9EURY|nr:MAG: DNA alkylation repair enzyme [Candidatus Methanofastidiosum methylthiophilus]
MNYFIYNMVMIKNLLKENIIEVADYTATYLSNKNYGLFLDTLKPILDSKCSFSKLDIIGKRIGYNLKDFPELVVKGFDILIQYNKMGSYVISSQGLTELLPENIDLVMEKSKEYILFGDKWYVCDIIGERSIGKSLVDYFDITLPWIERFLGDESNWIKRTAGVSIHFFNKRVINEKERTLLLLNILEPHIEEKQIDAVKGIGWGLKTIGKYHPDMLTSFLLKQLNMNKKISKILLRKALTYLPVEKREEIVSIV